MIMMVMVIYDYDGLQYCVMIMMMSTMWKMFMMKTMMIMFFSRSASSTHVKEGCR